MKRFNRFWRQLSIKVKLISCFFILLAMVSLFNVYLNNNNYVIMEQFNETMTNYYEINQLMVASRNSHDAVTSYLRSLNVEQKKEFFHLQEQINSQIEQLFDRFSSRDTYFELRAIKNSTEVYMAHWNKAIEQRDNQVTTYYNAFYKGESIEDYTENYIEELLYISLSEGNELYNRLASRAEVMHRVSMILIAGMFALALLIGALFSNYLINPIKDLAKASLRISSGDLDGDAVMIYTEDEVGVLGEAFNTMSANIKTYVNDLEQKVVIEKKLHEEEMEVVRMEQLLKDAQFLALQSQINPHFLFNTLNTISRTAMFEEADDTLKLIQALSHMFRYKLRNDSAIIPISEELAMIDEYIYLQKFRFKERLNYECIVDEVSRNLHIPIFTFQPLVENAIMHGIEPKVEGGTLRIKIFTKKNNNQKITYMRITDTGVGMSRQALESMMHFESKKTGSIGVENVYRRFIIAYQHRSSFRILSRKGMGTMVEMKFIWNQEDGHE